MGRGEEERRKQEGREGGERERERERKIQRDRDGEGGEGREAEGEKTKPGVLDHLSCCNKILSRESLNVLLTVLGAGNSRSRRWWIWCLLSRRWLSFCCMLCPHREEEGGSFESLLYV